jgi:hypothetical protein
MRSLVSVICGAMRSHRLLVVADSYVGKNSYTLMSGRLAYLCNLWYSSRPELSVGTNAGGSRTFGRAISIGKRGKST